MLKTLTYHVVSGDNSDALVCYTHTDTYIDAYTELHTYIHAYIHTYIDTDIHTSYIHAYIHTYMACCNNGGTKGACSASKDNLLTTSCICK